MNKKSALIKSCAIILVCLLSTVGIVFAWFSRKQFAGSEMEYTREFDVNGAVFTMTTYAGDLDENNAVIYRSEPVNPEDGFGETNKLFPGTRQYFKTVITNYSNSDDNISMVLENVTYDAVLDSHLYFSVTHPQIINRNYASVSSDTVPDADGTARKEVGKVYLLDKYDVSEQSEITVYWYVSVDTETDNDAVGANIHINKMRITGDN